MFMWLGTPNEQKITFPFRISTANMNSHGFMVTKLVVGEA